MDRYPSGNSLFQETQRLGGYDPRNPGGAPAMPQTMNYSMYNQQGPTPGVDPREGMAGQAMPGPSNPTVPLTGFASQYQGLPLWETIYQDPTAILPDVFPGIDPMGPGYNMLADLPFDPGLMYYMMQGSQPGTFGSGVNEYTNWLNQMYSGLGGGGWFDFGDMMGNLTGAGQGSELAFALQNLPAGEAAAALQGMLGAAATVGLNPLASRAMQNVIPGMFAGMSNNAIKTPLAQQGQGFNDPMQYLRQGLASIGMGF